MINLFETYSIYFLLHMSTDTTYQCLDMERLQLPGELNQCNVYVMSKPILPILNSPDAINLLLLLMELMWVLLKALLVIQIQDCHQHQWCWLP